MRVGMALAVAVWVFSAGEQVFAEGLLAGMVQDVLGHDSTTKSAPKKNGGGDTSNQTSCDDDDWGQILDVDVCLFSRRTEYRLFPAYPYVNGLSGYLQFDPGPEGLLNGRPKDELDLEPWSFRVSLEDGVNFDGINRFTGTIQAESRWGFGVYTSWNYLYENLGNGFHDDLIFGNVTATWRFLESRRLLLRAGVGVWLATESCGCWSASGINLHLSGDYFPCRPWVISGVIEGGSLGDTGIVHTRGTVGVLWRGLEFYGGYDFLQIGSSNLHTPMLGIRVWF